VYWYTTCYTTNHNCALRQYLLSSVTCYLLRIVYKNIIRYRLKHIREKESPYVQNIHHHHQHVPEGLGVFPVPWSSKWSWSLHLFFGRPMFLRPFGLYRNACFGILFLSILCTCCSHFFWYCFISCMFCAPVFPLIHWFFSLSNLLFLVSVSKIPFLLLLNVVPLFSSVPKLHFQFSMLL